ncbi:MAG: hypothetical protein OXU71_05625, partial [Gammaproteobacteria bacterium]|nr:hypothetical protein [Gammaproteobacteria bacterium]
KPTQNHAHQSPKPAKHARLDMTTATTGYCARAAHEKKISLDRSTPLPMLVIFRLPGFTQTCDVL